MLSAVKYHDPQVYQYQVDFGGGERNVVSLLERAWASSPVSSPGPP